MIEYSHFNQLPTWSQVDVLADKGTVVARREHKGWTISLYALNNYFVELWVKRDLEIIGSFHRSVKPLTILEPYLETMDVSGFGF